MKFTNRTNCRDQDFAKTAETYKPLIESLAAKYSFCRAIDADDLRQEALIGLFNAFGSYDETRSGVSFGLYAKICIRNRLVSFLRKADAPDVGGLDEDESGDISALSRDGRIELSPEDLLIEKEEYEKLISGIEKNLSLMERKVLDLYLDGRSYKEIASELSVSGKSVDNAICRIKNKIRKISR